MGANTGFSNVDDSGRSAELVDYLALVATRMAGFRRQGNELLKLATGAAVLDVGCGAGEMCVEFAETVGAQGRVVGVDPSAAMIDAAHSTARGAACAVELHTASVYDLPFADESFDAVRAERVFQHLEDPDAALREMLRVTRRGGRMLLMDPDHGQASVAVDEPGQRRVFEAARRSLLTLIVNPHSGVRLRAMMIRAGLGEVTQLAQVLEVAHGDFAHAFFLHDLLEAAVARDEITRDEARDFIDALAQREREGRFFANAIGYAVVGVRR
jgi:SAM-dependent methyltransferase